MFMIVTDRDALRPVRVGLEMVAALARLHGSKLDTAETWQSVRVAASSSSAVKSGSDPATVSAAWAVGEARWRQRRAKYLLYGAGS